MGDGHESASKGSLPALIASGTRSQPALPAPIQDPAGWDGAPESRPAALARALRGLPRRLTRADGVFVALLATVALVRLALLVSTQHHANGDESAIGVMAQHILAGERPLQASVGDAHLGSAMAGYLAAGVFALLGVSETTLELPALSWSLAAVVAVFGLVRATRGAEAGVVVAAFYATSVGLVKWSFYSAGGYIVCQALLPATLWLLLSRAAVPGRGRPRHDLLLGLLCGLGTATLVLFAPAAAIVALVLCLAGATHPAWARFLRFGLAFALGCAPLWLFDLGAGRDGVPSQLATLPGILANLWGAVTSHLPRMLAYDNIEGAPVLRLVPNGVAYAAILAGAGLLLACRGPVLSAFLRRLVSRGAAGEVPLEAPLLLYVLAYLVVYAAHPLAGSDARYLVPVEPALSILAGLGFYEAVALRASRPLLAFAACAVAVVALANGAAEHARAFGDDTVQGVNGRIDPRRAPAVARLLAAEGVSHVVTNDWDLAWGMTFQTQGRIRSCHAVAEHRDRLGDEVFPAGSRYAVIVRAESHWDRALERRAARAGIPARRRVVFDKAVHLLGPAGGDPRLPEGWCPPDLLMQPVSFGRARVAR